MPWKQKLIIHSFFLKQPSRLSKKKMMHIATARVFCNDIYIFLWFSVHFFDGITHMNTILVIPLKWKDKKRHGHIFHCYCLIKSTSAPATNFILDFHILEIAPCKCRINIIFSRIRKATIIKTTGLISNMLIKIDVQ